MISVKPTDETAPRLRGCQGPDLFSCKVSGMKLGANFRASASTRTSPTALALNVELRDMMPSSIPRAATSTATAVANNADLTWTHTWIVGANLVLYLPDGPRHLP